MSTFIWEKDLGVFKELYYPTGSDSNTVAWNNMSKPVPPLQHEAQKAENDTILAKTIIKSLFFKGLAIKKHHWAEKSIVVSEW